MTTTVVTTTVDWPKAVGQQQGTGNLQVSWTPPSGVIEDIRDISLALDTRSLYAREGRTAFISLKAYREKRK